MAKLSWYQLPKPGSILEGIHVGSERHLGAARSTVTKHRNSYGQSAAEYMAVLGIAAVLISCIYAKLSNSTQRTVSSAYGSDAGRLHLSNGDRGFGGSERKTCLYTRSSPVPLK